MEKNKTINQIIKDSLGIKNEPLLTESYVASEQKFNLPTEFLSASNKKNHEELYAGYIKNFNEISAKLDTVDREAANSNNSAYRSLKLDEAFNMNAVYLHELYFANISDLESNIQMDSLSYIKLSNDFGSFENWQKDFIASCMSSRCGWACTVLNTYLHSYQNVFLDLHSLNFPIGTIPIIVMDVWQHAYYKDYLKDVKTYTYAMMKELDWNVIEKRVAKAEKIKTILGM